MQGQGLAMAGFDESFQIQTPPPTRDPSSKRRSERMHPVVFGTPSSMLARQLPGSQASPDMARQMGFFSELAGFSTPGPATAPATMPNDIFWDPSAVSIQQQQQQQLPAWNSLADPFMFQMQTSAAPSPYPTTIAEGQAITAPLFQQNGQPYMEQQYHAPQRAQIPPPQPLSQSQSIPNMLPSAGVDPHLLYRSPTHAILPRDNRNLAPAVQQTTRSFDTATATRIAPAPNKLSRIQTNGLNALPPRAEQAARPGLRRSNTTGSSRPQSLYGSIDSLSGSQSAAPIQRRASPLKRPTRVSLSSISEANKPRQRTSVVLTVDSNGNARAETRLVEPSPTKSLKSRYPSLWDESDEESDSDASAQLSSRPVSFSASKVHERQSKVARLDPPLEGLEGLHLPRSNSVMSMRATPSKAAYAAAAQLRRQGSVKKSTHQHAHSRRNTTSSMNNSFTDLTTLDSSKYQGPPVNDAGAALRQAMEGRSSQTGECSLHPFR